jgi:hypothetical protein
MADWRSSPPFCVGITSFKSIDVKHCGHGGCRERPLMGGSGSVGCKGVQRRKIKKGHPKIKRTSALGKRPLPSSQALAAVFHRRPAELRPDLSGGDFPNDRKAEEPWSTVAA